jgi:heat shock protein HslJ
MVTPEGNLSGNASCNRMFGGGKIAGDTVAFGMIGTTKMACAALVLTDQEQRYLAALGKVAKWRMENGLLFFTDAAGKDVLRFSR